MPAPLPLGQSGASLVKEGSERRVTAAWMPLTKTGRSPGTRPPWRASYSRSTPENMRSFKNSWKRSRPTVLEP
jgi:hypothetical protein